MESQFTIEDVSVADEAFYTTLSCLSAFLLSSNSPVPVQFDE